MMSSDRSVFVTRAMPANVTARLNEQFGPSLNPDDRLWSIDEVIERSAGYGALMVCASDRLDSAAIARLPASIGVISTFSVGYEHIDVDAASARKILVTNTPDVLTDATADITLLCLLGAARRANEGLRLVRDGLWSSWQTTMLLGTHVTGKRIGIVGMGRIGQAVAARARGFGMQIHYHNRSRLAPELELDAVYHADIDALMPHCDFLSINAPATPETSGFLNTQRVAALPKGAVVVNTARGTLVDDEALIAGLESGHIAAAGLDVFAGEPKLNPAYRRLENVFALPHIGSATHETRDAMGFVCLDNIKAFYAGAVCPDALNGPWA